MRMTKAVLVSIHLKACFSILVYVYFLFFFIEFWRCLLVSDFCFDLGAGDMDMGGMGGMDFSVCL